MTHQMIRRFDPQRAQDRKRDRRPEAFGSATSDTSSFVEIEDLGLDVTIFAFAGLAVKYAGLPSFEFRRILQQSGLGCNLVFLRDIHRLSYHVTPSSEIGGLEFFEQQINRIRESLGASHNVGLGVSIGGSAAFYFATRCQLDQIIAFSPSISYSEYCSFQNQIRTYLNLARLIRSPRAYIEQVLVTGGMVWSYRRLRRVVGPTKIWSILDSYRTCRPRPRATVFYGTGCRPDMRQTEFLNFPEIKRVSIPTPYHNCAEFLKKRGELGRTITQEIKWHQNNFGIGSGTEQKGRGQPKVTGSDQGKIA